MPHKLTIELPDEVYEYFETMAAKAGQTVEEWALERLESIVPKTVFMTSDERAKALAELMKHTVDVGHATGIDNEQIDRDLADEYASTHEDER